MTLDELAFKRWLQRVTAGSGEKIKSSELFLSIMTANYEAEPQCALELGIAIMLDKPIYLLVANDHKLSENMARLARGVEHYDPKDPTSLQDATLRLLKRAGVTGGRS